MRPKIVPGYKPNYILSRTRKGKLTIHADHGCMRKAYRDNRTHVCFDCRMTVRRNWHTNGPKCPKCTGAMVNIGAVTRAPKRSDDAGWNSLRRWWWRRCAGRGRAPYRWDGQGRFLERMVGRDAL